MVNTKGNALIGLAFRHNRLDNYWFTLFHELSHVKLHLSQKSEEIYFDDPQLTNLSKILAASTYLKELVSYGILAEEKIGREKLFVHKKYLKLLLNES